MGNRVQEGGCLARVQERIPDEYYLDVGGGGECIVLVFMVIIRGPRGEGFVHKVCELEVKLSRDGISSKNDAFGPHARRNVFLLILVHHAA